MKRDGKRFWVVVLPGLLVLTVLVAGVLIAPHWLSGRDERAAGQLTAGSGDGGATGDTATVSRRDLVDRVSVDGTLAYGDERSLSAGKPGTLVAAADEGAVVERGQSLLTVDDRSLPLLYGSTPLWRTVSVGVADGPDVKQLEENLQALGFSDGLYFTIDEHFDNATQIAVQRWQKSLNRTQSGTVEKGDAVFQPGPVRVKERKANIGDEVQPGAAVLSVTGTERQVTVKLDPDRQSVVKEGDAVQIDLPGGKTIGGHVAKVGTVAATDSSNGNGNNSPNGNDNGNGSSDPKLTVTITIDDPNDAGRLDEAPVQVKFTKATEKHALAVPVNALLALREGGYAVEVVRDGKRTLVGVTLGSFADGYVAITGDVHEGDQVVMPR